MNVGRGLRPSRQIHHQQQSSVLVGGASSPANPTPADAAKQVNEDLRKAGTDGATKPKTEEKAATDFHGCHGRPERGMRKAGKQAQKATK